MPNAANGECMYVALLGKKNALYLGMRQGANRMQLAHGDGLVIGCGECAEVAGFAG